MKLKVNGDSVNTDAQTVKDLLSEFDVDTSGKGTAVAVNDSVVSRSEWNDHQLNEEDRVEIIRATQGG